MINQIGSYNVYIGNAGDAAWSEPLVQQGFTAVLNVATDLMSPMDINPIRLKVGLTDGPSNSLDAYIMASDLIEYLLKRGHKVLLHCHEGRSRSSAVATLWLARRENLKLMDSWNKICQYRPLCKRMELAHLKNLKRIFDD